MQFSLVLYLFILVQSIYLPIMTNPCLVVCPSSCRNISYAKTIVKQAIFKCKLRSKIRSWNQPVIRNED